MKTLLLLDYLAEIIQIIFELGFNVRKYAVPAVVFAYVAFVHYVLPLFRIPAYYVQVRRERLALA